MKHLIFTALLLGLLPFIHATEPVTAKDVQSLVADHIKNKTLTLDVAKNEIAPHLRKLLRSPLKSENKKGVEISAQIQQNSDPEVAEYIRDVERKTLEIQKFLDDSKNRMNNSKPSGGADIGTKSTTPQGSSVDRNEKQKSSTLRKVMPASGVPGVNK